MKKFQLFFFLFLIFSAVLSSGRTFLDIYSRAGRFAVLKEEVSELERENKAIKEALVNAEKDEFTEREARDRLGYSFPEEKVLIVSGAPQTSEPSMVLGKSVTPKEMEKPFLAWKKLLLW